MSRRLSSYGFAARSVMCIVRQIGGWYRGAARGGAHLVAVLGEEDLEFVRWLHGFDREHGNPIALRNKREERGKASGRTPPQPREWRHVDHVRAGAVVARRKL